MPLFLALALLAVLQTPVPADTSDTPVRPPAATASAEEGRAGVRVRPRVAPSAFYSAYRGVGVGVGVGVSGVMGPGSDATLDVRLQQHFQSVDLAVRTADPFRSRVHVLVGAGASTTDRRRFYGLGPGTVADDEVDLFHDAVQAEVRVGVYPLGTSALYLQPGVRVRYDRSDGVNSEASPNALSALDGGSRQSVAAATGDRFGASARLAVATDLLDWPLYPHRGLLAAVEHRRFFAFDDSDLTLVRSSASVTGYVPLRGRTALILHGLGVVTRSGDADGDGVDDPIPFYDLPVLDGPAATAFRPDRLTGRDLLAVSAGVRTPVADFVGLYGIDLVVTGTLGNAYDDVFEQFSPSVSFSDDDAAEGTAGLRPSLGVEIRLVDLRQERVVLGALVGTGPGGVTVATLQATYDLRSARPLFR